MTTSNKSAAFGNLLKGAINGIANYEGKTAPVIEEEVGALIGVSGKTIQRYKTGYLPPFERDNDAVRVLAEAAVRRGFLGREWLERFLHAARYPAAEKLLNELCPVSAPLHAKPDRVYQNLPAPTYSHFVMRQQAFAEVVDGIERRSAVVLVASLGGMGKTSLAREIAAHSLQEDNDLPHFDAVVWVSDRDRPGTTTFSLVLDTIAQTLDYPGIAQYTHSEKQYEVEQLLRRQRVLLVVDNFETITDGLLLEWLLHLPEPSKAIITTRQYRREFRNSAILVNLHGMTERETWELVDERLRVLRMETLVSDPTQLEPLLTATGGNPKAITLTMGLLKYERRPLQQIVDDLYAARGDLFDDLFSRAWALLDEAARQLLMIATFFVDSASSEALSATADVTGFDFDRAMERLTDLSLLDVQQADLASEPRYTLHPLVRAFAGARLAEQADFEKAARERWVEWYVQRIGQTECPWHGNDEPRYELLDHDQNTLYNVIEYLVTYNPDEALFKIIHEARCYYASRGLYDIAMSLDDLRVRAAQNAEDYLEEFNAQVLRVELLCKQDNLEQVSRYLPILQKMSKDNRLPQRPFLKYRSTLGFYLFLRGDIQGAQQIWESILDLSTESEGYLKEHVRYHIARCLYIQDRTNEAYIILQDVLYDSIQNARRISIFETQLMLTNIDLVRGNENSAQKRLKYLNKVCPDMRSSKAQVTMTSARLHTLRGELPQAHASLTEVIDLFERMGMRRELAEAREELARLEAQMAAAAE
jgi:hypothetical protein